MWICTIVHDSVMHGEPPGLFVVQLIIVKCSFANSILGPWMIRTCAAFGVVGLSWADRLPLKTEIANITRALFMLTPQNNSMGQMIEGTKSREPVTRDT